MFTKLIAALVLFVLMGFQAEAQETELQRIADVLDVATTKTFQFTGNGTMYSLGQSTSPAAAWPRQFVKSMTRVYDFTAGAMRDDIVRMAGQTQSVGPESKSFNTSAASTPGTWPARISSTGSGKPPNGSINYGFRPMASCGRRLLTTPRRPSGPSKAGPCQSSPSSKRANRK